MKNTCHFLSFMLCLVLSQSLVKGATIQPIERTVGKLKITIDPRMELLAVIHTLSTNMDLADRVVPYSKEIASYFDSFSSHEAVKLTESLHQKYNFNSDAPVAFMLHLSQPMELEPTAKYSNYITGRSSGSDNLEQYRKAMKQFAEASGFEAFWNSKIPFYNQILDMTIANMGEIDLVEAMEDYFNETQDFYNIIITPAFRGGKGGFVTGNDGKDRFSTTISTTQIKDGIPYLSADNIRFYIWHEYGHFFVNPLGNKYAERVKSTDSLFEPIKKGMYGQGYRYWYTCVNEHIIRATTVRLYDLRLGSPQSKGLLDSELKRRFIYIEPLVEKLKDFDRQRDENNVTFSAFYPELLNVLDSLQKIEYWKQFNMSFQGPFSTVMAERMSVIYPTRDSDAEALKVAQDYALQVANMLPPGMATLLADTTALQTDLSECGIFTLGTIESNLFLKQYASTLPFKVENQTMYADKEYTDVNLKFVTCVPNPHNPQNGMLIFTALSNKAIQDIFNPSLLSSYNDYILFLNNETIISRGVYKNKENKWTF
ncbi:DUF4932 domain-containing protein [Bacteroides sp. UBA939]|uniref:DUF4932 domain-containing protein n=1 Tax=Bacteroides sp. UBA939 TaxID=1946092 RepID=UPI0025C34843|nr:DUF4932 domain-containing protein [Bacteroides sp. UBA939]